MTGFLTIISKNYLPYARVLMQSVAHYHPEAVRLVVLTDSSDGYFDPASEPFEVIRDTDAGLPDAPWFHFRYTVLELNTAVKPWVLGHAFERYRLDKLFYFDPDIRLYSALTPLVDALDRHDIVLIPHLTAPLPNDGKEPSELNILRAGTYNLGFLGLKYSDTTHAMLQWWQTKLERDCKYDFARGLFVDQRWMDLVPGLFPNVGIWRDPAYNTAYWNLPSRLTTPPAFFHFSGFDAAKPERFSKYQNRFTLADTGPVQSMAIEYATELKAVGIEQTKHWPYSFRYLAGGTPIPDFCRTWEDPAIADPYSAEGAAAFFTYWNSPVGDSLLTRFALTLHGSRADLARLYPDPLGRDQESFLLWMLHHGKHEHSIPEAFLLPLRETWRALRPTHPDGSTIVKAEPPPRLWPHLPEIAEHVYASRADLHGLFPVNDPASFTRWLLSAGRSEYLMTQEEIAAIEVEHRKAVSALPAGERLRHLVLRHAARTSPPQPEAATRREHLLHPPRPPWPFVSVDPADPLLASLNACLPEGEPGGARFTLARTPVAATIGYFYEHSKNVSVGECREVWVPSSFLQDALGPKLNVPVLKVPPPLTGVVLQSHDSFTYLVSVEDPIRENLRDTILAFQTACPTGAKLRIHVTSSEAAPAAGPNIEVVTGDLDPHLAAADCLIALSRVDAFGITLGRAMASGLPVIATAYAGHLDLVHPGNAYLIDYVCRPRLGTDEVWAEPKLTDAVEAIRAVHRDPVRRASIAAAGQAYVHEDFSVEAIRARVDRRLLAIQAAYPSG